MSAEPQPAQSASQWAVGDRVRVMKTTAFTDAGEPGTVAALHQPGTYPTHVTLDNVEDPFDLIAVNDDELEALT